MRSASDRYAKYPRIGWSSFATGATDLLCLSVRFRRTIADRLNALSRDRQLLAAMSRNAQLTRSGKIRGAYPAANWANVVKATRCC